jgi:uncharacterized membrane protein YeaQ/YmgE (transglycosylase-associated protein family)
MIGMDFGSFVVLSIAGLIAAAVLHYGARYRILEGFEGFLAKSIGGWFGAWLGSPIFGHWFGAAKMLNVYIFPAFLGAFTAIFAITASEKALMKVLTPRHITLEQELSLPDLGGIS